MDKKLERQQLIGFAGLASHEEAIIDMAQRVYSPCLTVIRDIVDLTRANIIFADPGTPEGMACLNRSEVYTIAVQSRQDLMFALADATLHRPISPRAVLELLNNINIEKPFPGAHPDIGVSRDLPGLFRIAMTRTRQRGPLLLKKSGLPVMVLDPGRDRMGGDFSLLSVECFLSGDHYTAETVPAEDVARISEMQIEVPLYQCLWRLSHDLGGGRRLFGDDDDAVLRFRRWPNLSEAGISRDLLRAVSLLRYGSFDVSGACHRTRLIETDLLIILNAAWLTGELELVRGGTVPLDNGPGRAPAAVTASLLTRIRNRLSGI